MDVRINKVAVLGAGIMGAQIAAHFGNAGIEVVLFDLKSDKSDSNLILNKAILNLKKLNPKPIASLNSLNYITIANYDDNLELFKECDLIVEAIAERIDWKESLYNKISPYLKNDAIIASNTSGLSIDSLSKSLPEHLRKCFCGIHFFNPPRYMPLVELIPSNHTEKEILDILEVFLVVNLGKSVIRAKDTPNFIANRLGVFSMLSTCINTEKFNIPLEVVDKLTGKELGRAKSATFRTADLVGLDTFAHVVQTMTNNCKDGFEAAYVVPTWMQKLISNGSLGSKTKSGFYLKDKEGLKVFDIDSGEYRLSNKKPNKEIYEILKNGKSWEEKFEFFRNSELPEAKFLWACFRDGFHYASIILTEISDSPREMDLAIRWGFGWKEGVFEIWQKAGWLKIANWIKEDIEKGKSISKDPLPSWVFELKNGLYEDNKHFNFIKKSFVERSELSVYNRQLFPDLVIKEKPHTKKEVVYENSGVVLWHTGDNIAILSFKTKMCIIGEDVLLGIEEAIKIAEKKFTAMVIWQEKDIFSAGANLEEFGFKFMMNGKVAAEEIINLGHKIITKIIRYSSIPIVAAVKGFTFGGGCEIMLHCAGVVAALESYIGLIEAGVGLIPGWGGSTEMAYRSSLSIDPMKDFEKRFKNVAMAQVATSAREALEMGFLKESDTIVMNTKELLFVAKEKARFLAINGYRPPVKRKFQVFGDQGISTVKGLLTNMFVGKQISEHDMLIAESAAYVMCGGDVEKGTVVTEDWILKIEKQRFVELTETSKTAERIQYILENGKPLRN